MASETFNYDNLRAGDFPIVTDEVIIGAGDLSRGAILGKVTADGTYIISDQQASDGSEAPKAILLEDIDASAGPITNAAVALTGEFAANDLTAGVTTTAADHEVALRALSIFVKETLSD